MREERKSITHEDYKCLRRRKRSQRSNPKMETVSMDLLSWVALLEELHNNVRVINRDSTNAVSLYNEIATQVYGRSVTIEAPKPREQSKVVEPKKWYKRIFS